MMRFNAPLANYKFENNSLTIIYFKDGVGELYWKDKRVKISGNKFIITNPSLGWEYINEREEYIDVLSLVICDEFREQFNYFNTASRTQLLDDPFHRTCHTSFFLENAFGADYYRSGKLLQQIYQLSTKSDYKFACAEELSIAVLQAIYQDQCKGYVLASHIEAKKQSTKIETLKRLLLANEYINDHITSAISLDDLSQVSSLSKYHLYSSFKNIYGKTPHQYINRLKMARAKEHIQRGVCSISEVSDFFGFSDLCVFSKVFKKVYGNPPSHYQLRG